MSWIFIIVSFITREKDIEMGQGVFVDPSEVPGPSPVPFGRRAADRCAHCEKKKPGCWPVGVAARCGEPAGERDGAWLGNLLFASHSSYAD